MKTVLVTTLFIFTICASAKELDLHCLYTFKTSYSVTLDLIINMDSSDMDAPAAVRMVTSQGDSFEGDLYPNSFTPAQFFSGKKNSLELVPRKWKSHPPRDNAVFVLYRASNGDIKAQLKGNVEDKGGSDFFCDKYEGQLPGRLQLK